MFFFLLFLFRITASVESSLRIEAICSGHSKILTCRSESVIRIFRAKIENKIENNTCRSEQLIESSLVLCERSKSEEVVRQLCEGQRTCKINFAECPYPLQITYQCEEQLRVDSTSTTATTATSLKTSTIFSGCRSRRSRGILWRDVPGNHLIEQKCPEHYEGNAWWKCDGSGEWIGEPNLYGCVKSILLNFSKELNEESFPLQRNETCTKLKELIDEVSTGGDIKAVCDVLKKILGASTQADLQQHSLRALLDVVGILVDERTVNYWREIPSGSFHLWNLVSNLSSIVSSEVQLHHIHRYIEVNTSKPEIHSNCNDEVSMNTFFHYTTSIASGFVHLSSKSCSQKIMAMDVRNILPLIGMKNTKYFSNFLTVAARHQNWTLEENNLTIILKLKNHSQRKVSCFRWTPFENSSDTHSECKRLWINSSHVACQCSSPSTFVAMETSETAPSVDSHQASFPIAAYIGCVLGITGMIITVILYTYLTCKRKKDLKYVVYMNYSTCQASNTFMCLIGLSQVQHTLCTIVALVLHYCSLVGIMWLLCGSFHIYLSLIRNKRKNSISQEAWFYVMSASLPLIIVIISGVISYESYSLSIRCWLNNNSGLEWAFIGPAIVMLWFSVALNCVSWKTLKNSLNEIDCVERKSRLCCLKSDLKRLILLIILSNMVWCSWLLHVYLSHLFFAYLFSVFSTLVGLLVIFNAASDVKVRNQDKAQSLNDL